MADFASIAAGAGSLIGGTAGLFSGFGAKKAAKRQLQNQLTLNQDAYDKNLAMWNLQNEYNDPSAQVARLEAAGINPVTSFGGSTSSGNSSSSPTYEAPHAPNYAESALHGWQTATNSVMQLLSAGEQLKSQKLDNTMKAIDVAMYADQPGIEYSDDGTVGTATRRPGVASLKREQLIRSLERSGIENFLLDTYGSQERESSIGLNKSKIENLRKLNEDIDSKIGLRNLDSGLKQLELQWYNSSKFIRNVSPFLNLLRRR